MTRLNIPDFERDRAAGIVRDYRAGATLGNIADYYGMEEKDCAAIIQNTKRIEPSFFVISLCDKERDHDRIRAILPTITTPRIRNRLQWLLES